MGDQSDPIYPPSAATAPFIVREDTIEFGFIGTLQGLKYEYRRDITNRASLEQNFREKFEALNRVKLTDTEFARLLEEIVTHHNVTDIYKNFAFWVPKNVASSRRNIWILIWSGAMIILGAVSPYFWIVAVALGGLVVGSWIWRQSRTKGLRENAKKKLSNVGLVTMGSMSAVLVFGLIFVPWPPLIALTGVDLSNAGGPIWFFDTIFVALALSVFMWVVREKHASREAGATLLGLRDKIEF